MRDDGWQREYDEVLRKIYASCDLIIASLDRSIASLARSIATCDRILENLEELQRAIDARRKPPPSVGFV